MTRRGPGYSADLLWLLTRTEFRQRDQGTFIGFLWTLLHPLGIFLILHSLFTGWMSPRVPNYPAYLLIGIVQWNFFSTATGAGLTSLRRKAGLMASYAFPRWAVVLSSVGAVLLSHLLEWAVLLAALLVMGVAPTSGWLALPLLVAVEAALATGLALALSVLAVEARDLEHAWSLLLYGVFFLTPVFYSVDLIGPGARAWVEANPVALILDATRSALLGGGSFNSVASASALAFAACVAGAGIFAFRSPGVVERL